MRLATVRRDGRTAAVRLEGNEWVELGPPDVGQLLRLPDWPEVARRAQGPRWPVGDDFAPLVPDPDKVLCVGLNYRSHILEMGHELPRYPTLFAKYRSSLVGARDDIVLPLVSDAFDWEAELAVVIGRRARHVSEDEAAAVIAGYTVFNDGSVRDYQLRSSEWLQGKTFEASTPVGPYLVTTDESPGPSRHIECEVNGELVQKADTADLVFGPAALVAYVSDICTLEPGDLIATGTPGGVGAARTPPRFLADGDVVVTRVTGLGECRNLCRKEQRHLG